MYNNLTTAQKIAIAVAILSVLSTSSALLTDIVGAGYAKIIVAFSGLGSSAMSSVLAVLTGQASTVQTVRNMPGIENVIVNRNANETLARLAVDPAEPKISVLPSDKEAVIETAKGDTK